MYQESSQKALNYFYFKMVKNFLKKEGTQVFTFLSICQLILFVFYKTLNQPGLILGVFNPYLSTAALATLVLVYYIYPKLVYDDHFLEDCLSSHEKIYQTRVLKLLVASHLVFFFVSFIPLVQLQANGITLLAASIMFIFFSLLVPLIKKESRGKGYRANLQGAKKEKTKLKNKAHAIRRLSLLYISRKNRRYFILALFYSLVTSMGVLFYLVNQAPESPLFYLLLPYLPLVGTALAINTEAYKGLANVTYKFKHWGFKTDLLFWFGTSLVFWVLVTTTLLFLPIKINIEVLVVPIILLVFWVYILMIKFLYLENHLLKSMSLALSIVVPLSIPIFAILFIKEVYYGES